MKKGNEIKKLKKELMELKEERAKKPKAKKPKAKKDVFADQLKPSVDWGY